MINPAQLDINLINDLAIAAGKKILEVFGQPSVNPAEITDEEGNSDLVGKVEAISLSVISKGLTELFPYPIISDLDAKPFDNKKWDYETYWLVDPLDGTKEFKARHEDFTLNIALVHQSYPVVGVVYVPSADILYFANARGAFQCESNKTPRKLSLPKSLDEVDEMRAVVGRFHASVRMADVLSRLRIMHISKISSSLKFCMIAEGRAHVFFRDGLVREWDAAAGQAIIEQSGGCVVDSQNQRLKYHGTPTLADEFICFGSSKPDPAWNKD